MKYFQESLNSGIFTKESHSETETIMFGCEIKKIDSIWIFSI